MEQMNIAHELEDRFGKTFMQHVERLAGSALPAVDFPIDVATLACLVLLTEREGQLKSNESTSRFTPEALSLEISELGVPMNGNLQEIIRMLERSGYVRVQEDSFLVSETPLLEMCRLLDEIFPRMPGLNLVAYLVQTMEEVLSGRKGLDEAHQQLDQVLEMHGAPLSGIQTTNDANEAPSPSSESSISTQKDGGKKSKKALDKENRQTMLKLLQAAARNESQKRSFPTSRVIRSEMIVANKSNLKKMDSLGESRPENESSADLQVDPPLEKEGVDALSETGKEALRKTGHGDSEKVLHENAEMLLDDGKILETPIKELPVAPQDPEKLTASEGTKAYDDLGARKEGMAEGKEEGDEKVDDVVLDVGKQEDILSDKAIEERIAVFEEDLAMTCPLCGKGKIETRETAKGKRFYECSRDGCYFISWGKPYHLSCPKCRNNFLIEAVEAAGKVFLKCPMATCNYKQNLPGQDGPFENTEEKGKKKEWKVAEKPARKPKKKVVRRRLVRRKK